MRLCTEVLHVDLVSQRNDLRMLDYSDAISVMNGMGKNVSRSPLTSAHYVHSMRSVPN